MAKKKTRKKNKYRKKLQKIPKTIKKRSKKVGLPPGSLVHIGERKADKIRISLIDYDDSRYIETEIKSIKECCKYKDKPTVTWVNLEGIYSAELIEEIGKYFNINELSLEDIMNTGQRPKIEYYPTYIFVIVKMLSYNDSNEEIICEQVSMIIDSHFVISFQEDREGDVFEPIRDRIRNNKGKIRKMGNDYLAYSLIDAIIDNYFIILEKLGEKIDVTEDRLFIDNSQEISQQIHYLKRQILFLFRSIWPLREVVNLLLKSDNSIIKEDTQIYLRDIYDHILQIIDTIETYRDILSEMFNIYFSSISNKTNEIMKILAIFATIFSPLTFIVGIYGMNFENMPELKWHWGYALVWVVIILVAIFMLLYFKRKKWL